MPTYSLRVIDKSEDGGVFKLVCEDFDTEIFNSTAVAAPNGGNGSGGSDGGPTVIGSTMMEVLDIPLLRTQDDYPGIYLAAVGTHGTWPGCAFYRSTDDGVTFEEVGRITTPAVIGYTTERPGLWYGGNQVDPNGFTVEVHGELSSITHAQLMNGGNLCVVGNEVMQFRNATLTGEGTYVLTGLLRGLQGTESYILNHAFRERFVLLDRAALLRVESPVSLMGQTVIYRAVSLGNAVTQGHDEEHTELQTALLPLAPVGLNVASTGSAYVATWTRQSRYPAPWTDYADAPVGEQSEKYLFRVVSGVTQHLSQIVTGATTLTFGNGTAYSTYEVQVSQLSDVAGPGRAAKFTIL